jgi:hypothetical protein
MRYLKVIAQDRSGSGQPDSLHFRFYENEQMVREATPAELQRLKSLGATYLKCAWFNAGEHTERHLRMYSPTPGSVRLHFHDGPTIIYKAAAHDLDNDGVFEVILSSDVDNDGRANRTDRNRVRTLAREFLKLDG